VRSPKLTFIVAVPSDVMLNSLSPPKQIPLRNRLACILARPEKLQHAFEVKKKIDSANMWSC